MRAARIKILPLAIVTSLLALALGETAHGAIGVSAVGGQLVVRATGPEMNVVDVRDTGLGYVVFNGTSEVIPGDGCADTTVQPVRCDVLVLSINVEGGEATDLIGLEDVDVSVVADGGAGDDAVDGGSGRNSLKGGVGVDQLVGGSTADDLDGGRDDDLLVGGSGSDRQLGGSGDDIIMGGKGEQDDLSGQEGQDLLLGGSGGDLLDGGSGDDVLAGGSANDRIAPGSGENRILGKFDKVSCGPKDQANSPDCKPLEGRASVPSVWPPKERPTSPSSSRAFASLRQATAWPRVRGKARKITVHIPAKRSKRVRACIRTYNFNGRRLDRYPKRVKTRYKPSVGVPAHSRPAWTASAHPGQRCRKKRF
jgi:RTX calcium-binding nonapeptide repeat (4 copies)